MILLKLPKNNQSWFIIQIVLDGIAHHYIALLLCLQMEIEAIISLY